MPVNDFPASYSTIISDVVPADGCSPFEGEGGRRHMLPRSSLPPAAAGRFDFAALKNALADDDDDDDDDGNDELDGIVTRKPTQAAGGAGTGG